MIFGEDPRVMIFTKHIKTLDGFDLIAKTIVYCLLYITLTSKRVCINKTLKEVVISLCNISQNTICLNSFFF
jgi:hypothetical protein